MDFEITEKSRNKRVTELCVGDTVTTENIIFLEYQRTEFCLGFYCWRFNSFFAGFVSSSYSLT